MCGISGIIGLNQESYSDLLRMQDSLSHRGPDGSGIYQDNHIVMGSQRLSIIDPASDPAPILNQDRSLVIVYNGEIYNYRSLREELINKGYHFKTRTDTEVILNLYEEYGFTCLDKLQGMFAFAIWNKHKQSLFLARDRMGQKPLFYAHINNSFIFGSEIKAILSTKRFRPAINFESVHHYLSHRYIPSPNTMFKGIEKLPPAHYMIYEKGKTTLKRYWDIDFSGKLQLSESDVIEGLNEKIGQAVASHLVSDVPIGAYLSGGLDSSTIVTTVSGNIKTFCIGMEESDFNEIPYAREVAQYKKTELIEKMINPSFIKSLPTVIRHLDEPSDPIAACWYEAAKLAAQHVKVVLGGDGGDELFAGYDRYSGMNKLHRFGHMLLPVKSFLNLGATYLPESFRFKNRTQKLRWINRLLSESDGAARYAEANFFFRFNHSEKKMLYTEKFWSQCKDHNSSNLIKHYFDQPNADTLLDKMTYTDLMTRLPEHLLMMTDRLHMAQSIEARSPFLDHRLIEFVANIPSSLKMRRGHLKYLLKKAMEKKLPKTIIKRKKQGFMFPMAYWLRTFLTSKSQNLLVKGFFVRDGFFKASTIKHLIDEHLSEKRDHHVKLWMLLNLEIWHQLYFEHQSICEIEQKLTFYGLQEI